MTDAIKYLKLLIVQLESVPVLLGYSRFKEALWTRAVNFLLASSRPETEPCVHSVVLQRGFFFFFHHVAPNLSVSQEKLSY